MMIVMLHQASRGGCVKACQVQDEAGHLQSAGGESVGGELGSGGTAVTRESGEGTEIEVETERGIGMQSVKKESTELFSAAIKSYCWPNVLPKAP